MEAFFLVLYDRIQVVLWNTCLCSLKSKQVVFIYFQDTETKFCIFFVSLNWLKVTAVVCDCDIYFRIIKVYVYIEVVLVWNLINFVDSTLVSDTHLLINMREWTFNFFENILLLLAFNVSWSD